MSKVYKVISRTSEATENAPAPNPEVKERPTRRTFSAEYKQKILQEAAKCKPGELGALLRQEGLYSSHLAKWREQERVALSPQKRGRKAKEPNPLVGRVAELEQQNAELQKRIAQAEAIIEVQKKISEILGVTPKR